MGNAREKLLQAATRVFSEKGYRGASTRDIARRAKVNPVTLFRLFGGKARLHAAVVKHLFATSNLTAELESRLRQPLEGADTIRVAIQAICEAMFQAPASCRIILYSILEGNTTVIRTIWRDLGPIYALLAGHIENGIRRQRLRRVDSVAAARLIVAAAIHHYQVYELYSGKKRPRFGTKDLSRQYADIVHHGLKAE